MPGADPIDRSTPVGFVGLGNLGQGMALALARDGWPMCVLDRAPEKAEPLAREGARVIERPSDLAECGVVCLCVPDDAAVEAVLEGPDGVLDAGLAAGSVVVVHSTVLPATAQRLAEVAAGRGFALLDAPVSGGGERALEGELTIMVGGEAETLERVRPLLDALGSVVLHAGPAGAGEATKLANQLMMLAALAGTYEALDLARAYGVEEEAVLSAVQTSTGDCWVARNWGFFDTVATAYDEGGTPVRERPWSKDLWEVVAAARAADVSVPVAGLLSQHVAGRVESHAKRSRGESDDDA
jgi:3-hydroxyisobutyrate dehydrogenase-like beta-hydroxyacid dehydrogenase